MCFSCNNCGDCRTGRRMPDFIRCHACGKPMEGQDAECPSCGAPNELLQRFLAVRAAQEADRQNANVPPAPQGD